IPADQLGSHDLVTADALTTMFGSTVWGKLVIAGGLAGIITSWNAFLMGSSRLMWAMANAGMIPRWFGKLHPRYRTPVNAIIFIGFLSALAPFLGEKALNWISDAGRRRSSSPTSSSASASSSCVGANRRWSDR